MDERKARASDKWLDPETPGGDADKTINAMTGFAESEINAVLDALRDEVELQNADVGIDVLGFLDLIKAARPKDGKVDG